MQLNPAKIQINPVLHGYFFSVLKELIMRNLDNPAAINNDDLAITKLWDQINAYHMDMHLHLADLFEKLSPIYNGMLPLSLTEPLPAKAASKPVKATVKLSEEDKQKNAASFLPKDSPKSGKKAPSQKASEKKKAAALASEKRAENPVEKPRVFVTDSFTKVKKHFTEGKTVNIEELIKFYYRSLKNKRTASVREQLHAVMGLSRCLELMDTQQRQQVIKDLKAKASIIFASDLLSAEEKALEKNFKIAIERHCTTETKCAGQDAKKPGKQPAPAKPVAPKQPAKQLVTKEKSNTKEKPKTTTKNSATFFKQAPAKPHVSNAPTKELARAPQVTAFKSIETLEVVVTAPALTTTTTLPPAPPCTVPTIPMTVMLQPVMLMPIFPVPVIPIPNPPIDHAIFTRMNLNIHLDDIEKSVMNALRSNNLLPLIHGGAVIDTIYGKKPRDIDMLCFSSIQNLQMIIRNIDLPDIQVKFRADKNNVLHIDFQAFNKEMAHARTIHSLDIICLQGTTFEERMLSLKALANGFPVNWTLYYDYFEKMLLDPVHQKFKIFGKILDFTHDDIDLQHEAIINPGIIAYIIEKLVRYHNCGVKPSERLVEALLSLNPAYLLNSVIPESRFKKLFLTGRAMDTLKMLQQYKLVSFVFKNIDEVLLESECQRLDHELQKDFNYMRSDFQYAQQQVFLQTILYEGFAKQTAELYDFKKFSIHCSGYLKSQNFYIEDNVKLVITLDWWQKLNQAKLQSAEASPEAICAEGSQTVFNSIRRN